MLRWISIPPLHYWFLLLETWLNRSTRIHRQCPLITSLLVLWGPFYPHSPSPFTVSCLLSRFTAPYSFSPSLPAYTTTCVGGFYSKRTSLLLPPALVLSQSSFPPPPRSATVMLALRHSPLSTHLGHTHTRTHTKTFSYWESFGCRRETCSLGKELWSKRVFLRV